MISELLFVWSTLLRMLLILFFFSPQDESVPFHRLLLSTASIVSVAILLCLVEPKYINTIIRGAVGGSVLLSNKQWPCGITCHDSYMSASHYHPRSTAVWEPSSFCCVHLASKWLRRVWLLIKNADYCNLKSFFLWCLQRAAVHGGGGSLNSNTTL